MDDDLRQLGNPGTPAFQLNKYPFYLLNRAVSRYNAIIEKRLRGIGIDIPTWRVLMILGEAAPRSVSQIAEAAVDVAHHRRLGEREDVAVERFGAARQQVSHQQHGLAERIHRAAYLQAEGVQPCAARTVSPSVRRSCSRSARD